MPKPDLILLHAPSVYDFRDRPTMYGPISDVIPSTPIFEMYPLGFVSIVGYLEQNGYNARIVNLAVKMLKHPQLDVEKLISKLDALAYAIDLHWLAHAAGSLDIAKIVKKYHPEAPILLGGLSASYYHTEIIHDFQQVDYIIRGDTAEKPLLHLMNHIEKQTQPEDVANLTWRDKDGKKRANPLTFVPENIDDLWLDYEEVVKLVVRHQDLESTLPYEGFIEYPFTALLTCKGCNYNCITCGGSCYTFRNSFGREKTAFKTPERLVEEMRIVNDYFNAPLFLIGDLRQAGLKKAEEVLDKIRQEDFDNTITYELFDAASRDYMKRLADSANSWTLEISPETHEDHVRATMGKPYTTSQMERTIKNALDLGCGKFDVYFMIGLSKQTRESAINSVNYSRRLIEKMDRENKIHTFITPMAPFLDPGSIIYENPGKYGFTQLYRTLREHKEALYQPSWKLYLSYHTDWMTRDEIVDTTYDSMIGMNELKAEMGVINRESAHQITTGLKMAKNIIRKIDKIIESSTNKAIIAEKIKKLQSEIEEAKESTGLVKKELRMPGTARIRLMGALKYLLKWAKKSL